MTKMNGDPKLYEILERLKIDFQYHEHPETPTVEDALMHWKDLNSTHCKNIFFRNHKGNQHYLVIIEHSRQLAIRDLEQRLKQGKLSFASDSRLSKYLGLKAGSVSIFGIINDTENHAHIFIDEKLKTEEKLSFHPNINTATLVVSREDIERFLTWSGNSFEYIKLYDD